MDAAARSAIVQIAVPWNGHHDGVQAIASALGSKIVISCVNPLGFDRSGAFGLPLEESAAEQCSAWLPRLAWSAPSITSPLGNYGSTRGR